MKSAYERAMERFGSEPIQKLSDEQRESIAAIERVYTSRIAQAELAHREALRGAKGDGAKQQQLRERVAAELASLKEKCEHEKDKVRNASD